MLTAGPNATSSKQNAACIALVSAVLGVPIYINVAIGVVLMAMAASGLWCYRRGLRDGEVDPKLIP